MLNKLKEKRDEYVEEYKEYLKKQQEVIINDISRI